MHSFPILNKTHAASSAQIAKQAEAIYVMFPRGRGGGGGGAGPQPRWKSSKQQQQQQQHLCFREQVSPAPASCTYPPLSRASEARPEHWKSSPATQLPPERDAGHPGTTLPLVPVSPARGGKGEGRRTEEVEGREEGLFLMLNHPALMLARQKQRR